MAKLLIKKTEAISDKESPNSLKIKVKAKEPDKPVVADDNLKSNWNKYLDWLEKKGMKGNPELDKGDVGNKLFKQYLIENPEAKLSEKDIPVVRQAYKEMREQGLKDFKEGKAKLKDGDNPENFMRHIVENEKTANPNYVGQHLTQTRFPGVVLGVKNVKGKTVKEVSLNLRPSKATDVAAMQRKLLSSNK